MKREFLKTLGLADDLVDKIMVEHGNGIESLRGDLKTAQEQLKVANDKITSFGNVDAIKADVEKYKADYAKAVKDHENYVAEQAFDTKLKDGLATYKPKNYKMVVALLDIDTLKKSVDFDGELKKQMTPLIKDNPWGFDLEGNPQFTNPDPNKQPPNNNLSVDKLREAMGLSVAKK